MADNTDHLDDWVRVEERWFGLERRTIAPALSVLAFVLVLAYLVPAIESAVPYDDEVQAGDVIALSDGVTFVPTAGWDIEQGVRVGDEPVGGGVGRNAAVTDGVVSYEVTVGPFDGDAEALVGQVAETTDAINDAAGPHVVGDAVVTRSADGTAGAVARFRGAASDGLLVAFSRDGVGVQVVVSGPPDFDGDRQLAEDIAAMIASTTLGGDAS